MTIYIDIILLINFIIDLLLLLSVSFLLKRRASITRIIISSSIGSLSTLLLFVIHNNFLLLIYKLLISIIMIIITFKYNNFHYFKDNLIYLYIISIVLGGTIYLINNQISSINNGLIFTSNNLKINLFLLIIITPIIIYKYLKTTKKYQITYSNYYDIDIYYNDLCIKGTAFLDTGNNLKDPYFKRPIILINKELINEPVKTFLVPYSVVNNQKGLLEVFSPKKIIINNKKCKKTLLGLSDININGIKIILNKEALWLEK